MVLYSDPMVTQDDERGRDPWQSYGDRLGDDPRSQRIASRLEQAQARYPAWTPGTGTRVRLELLKNRGGRGRGSQLLVYEQALQRLGGVDLEDAAARQ